MLKYTYRKENYKGIHTSWRTPIPYLLLFGSVIGFLFYFVRQTGPDASSMLLESNQLTPTVSKDYEIATTEVLNNQANNDHFIHDRVKLELNGIVVKDNDRFALIRIDDGLTVTVEEGDVIASGLVLEEIKSKSIIVRHTQELERVALQAKSDHILNEPVDSDRVSIKQEGRTAVRVMAEAVTNDRMIRAEELPDGIQNIGNNQYEVNRDSINELFSSPDLFKQVRIESFVDGGYIFKAIGPESAFNYLGIRIGDVITEMNGKPINTLQDLVVIQNELDTGFALQIKLWRSNNPQYLYYYFLD